MGRLGRAKGLNGELTLNLFNPDSELLFELTSVFVGNREDQSVEMTIESIRDVSSRLVISFDGINTREQAEKLTNQYLYVDQEDLPELPPGNYYHRDILGFEVYSTKLEKLGILKQILTTASNEVYVVQGEEELYLPNIPGVIQKVLKEEKRIIVDPPEYVHAV